MYENLSMKQAEFLRAKDKRLNFLTGSVRSGKTFVSLIKWCYFVALSEKGSEFLMSAKTMYSLKRNCLELLRNLAGDNFEYSLSAKEGILFDRTIYFEGASNEESTEKLRGMTIKGAYLDEATLMPENFFKMVLSRLSTKDAKLFATLNPDRPSHYIKKDYLDNKELDLNNWEFFINDNIFLDKKYLSEISKEYSGVFYDRFILGKWAVTDGLVYPFFNKESHVIKKLDLDFSEYYLSMDYGIQNATSMGLWGSFDDCWYRIDEFYHSGRETGIQKTDEDYYQDMKALIEKNGAKSKLKAIIIDPSAASFISLVQQKNEFRCIKANNKILAGIQNCSSALEKKQIKIFENCEAFISEILEYSWDKDNKEDLPVFFNDHAMDDFRYFVRTVLYKDNKVKFRKRSEFLGYL